MSEETLLEQAFTRRNLLRAGAPSKGALCVTTVGFNSSLDSLIVLILMLRKAINSPCLNLLLSVEVKVVLHQDVLRDCNPILRRRKKLHQLSRFNRRAR